MKTTVPYSRILLIVPIALVAWALSAKAENHNQPNILFILADDLTFRDIGCYGSENVETPHIDSLAENGMRFTRCFQAAPMCSPTRHNIYTGLYPVKTGAYPNATWAKDGTKSVAHYLKEAGYRVGLTGKRHIAPEEVFPFDYLSESNDPDMAALEEFLTRDKEQPSCTFLCFNEPHTPWTLGDPSIYDPETIKLPPYFVDTQVTRKHMVNYYAEVKHLDDSVGKVTALLDKLNLTDNTVLVFASEQGNAMPFAKWTCYDSGLQSALIARWPGKITLGSKTDAMVEYVDILPTFLEIAGVSSMDVLDGESFVPVLFGKRQHHKKYVYALQTTRGITNGSEHYGIRSIRSERFKFILNLTPEATFQNNLTENKGGWTEFWPTWVKAAQSDTFAKETIHRYQHRPSEELYDIVEDPYEFNNLAEQGKYKTIKKDLRLRLLRWMDEQGDLGQATEMDAMNHTNKPGPG
ncbi:MAG: sulfatase [Verrucomicrobia bacterium]|nr:sulfatase [Verrucomicrobiota bacterium]